jgi:TatA/E family protein of Tat protein translocase
MFGIGPQELLVILIVGLLVLGPKRLPEIARSLGKGLAEFRRASSDLRQSLALEDEPKRHAPPPRPPAQAGQGELAAKDDPAEGRNIAPPHTTAPSEPVAAGTSTDDEK